MALTGGAGVEGIPELEMCENEHLPWWGKRLEKESTSPLAFSLSNSKSSVPEPVAARQRTVSWDLIAFL